MRTTPPLAAFGFFNSPISLDQIRGHPMDEEIKKMKESAADLDRALEKMPSGEDSAGKRLKQAVKRKTEGRAFVSAAVTSESDDDFGEKLKEAVKRKLGSQHKDRYRHKPRPHTKSD
jgi:hypothetical protein